MAVTVVALWLNTSGIAFGDVLLLTFAVLVHSARPLDLLRLGVCAAMLLSFIVVLLVPWLSNFFAVYVQPERDTAIAVGTVPRGFGARALGSCAFS